MGKQKIRKGIQTVVCICSMFILAFLFVLTDAEKAKASSYEREPGQDQCSLYSVTFEIDGKEYVCDGSLRYITVDSKIKWKDYFKKLKITDYTVLVDDCCSHVKDHKSISACVGWREGWGYETKWLPFYTYEDDGNEGKNTNTDVEKDLNDEIYNVRFYLDDDKNAYINIAFIKEYQISYELNGGSFPEGLDVPKTLLAGGMRALVSPVKSGSQFLGWKKKGQSDEGYEKFASWDGTGEAPTYVAYWKDGTDPIDISGIDISISEDRLIFDEEEVTVRLSYISSDNFKLKEGTDYFLSYRNNDKAAAADSDNPPTVIIKGIGKYTGKVEKKFSISKSHLYLPYYEDGYVAGNFLFLDIVKGKPLSSIDLSDARAYARKYCNCEIKGTFSWEKGDYVPDAQEGDVLQNDSANGETTYNLIFTPDNQDIYSRTIFSKGVQIRVKKGNIADCSVTFASGQQTYSYTGADIKPGVIVKDGDVTLIEGQDYEVSYGGYKNAAGSTDTYAPTVIIKGIGEYLGTRKITYTIEKATPYIVTGPAATVITYGQTLDDSLLSGGVVQYSESDDTVLEGTFTWKEPTIKPTVADSGKTKYTVVFTPTNKNYDSVETDITLTVNKAETAPNKPESTMNVYKTTVKAIVLPAGWIWQDADKTKALTVGEPVTITAVYNGADKGNYETESVEITVTRLVCTHAVTEVKNMKSATCTEKGYTGDTYCVACEERLKTGTETGTLGHDFATEFTVDKEPTCTTVGSKSKHCSRCAEKTEVTEIAKTDHTWGAGKVIKEATCVEKGEMTYTCANEGCGATKTEDIAVDTGKHRETEIKDKKEATCTEKGYTGDTYCKDCGAKIAEGEVMNALGHDMTKAISAKVEATCTTDGKEAVIGCSRCEHTQGGERIEALGHDFATEFTIDKEATCSMEGSKSKHCSRCDEKTEVTEITRKDHTWDAGKVTKEATETAEGVKTYTCTGCKTTKTEVIPKKETTTSKKLKKDDVAKADKGTAWYKAVNAKKKEVVYKAPANKKAKTISISTAVKINGVTYKVTGIANSAFKGNKRVTKITVGSNIKSIGNNVFSGATKLKTIKIKSVKLTSKTVSKNAFKGLKGTTTIKVQKKKLKAYKKLFKSKGLSSKVKVKSY